MFGVSQIIHTLVDSSGGFCFFQVFQFVSSILDFFLFAKAWPKPNYSELLLDQPQCQQLSIELSEDLLLVLFTADPQYPDPQIRLSNNSVTRFRFKCSTIVWLFLTVFAEFTI